jgi:Xaa-Pro aminopeptidase
VGGHYRTKDTDTETQRTYPNLRCTKEIHSGHVFTIEPGLYFIPMLLEKLKEGKFQSVVNWNKVQEWLPYGGIRIEDDIVAGDHGFENLTRDAFQFVETIASSANGTMINWSHYFADEKQFFS